MARTICYHFFVSSTSAGEQGSISIRRSGRIVGVQSSITASGGAGIGRYGVLFKLNDGTSNPFQADWPPEGILDSCYLTVTGATDSVTQLGPYHPLDIPVQSGDRISSNIAQAGTSPAAAYFTCLVTVKES